MSYAPSVDFRYWTIECCLGLAKFRPHRGPKIMTQGKKVSFDHPTSPHPFLPKQAYLPHGTLARSLGLLGLAGSQGSEEGGGEGEKIGGGAKRERWCLLLLPCFPLSLPRFLGSTLVLRVVSVVSFRVLRLASFFLLPFSLAALSRRMLTLPPSLHPPPRPPSLLFITHMLPS